MNTDFISVPLIIYIIFTTVYGIFELCIRKRERMAIIEKMGDKFDTSQLIGNFTSLKLFKGLSFGALKGGSLLVGIGLGLLIGFLICVNSIPDYLTTGGISYESQRIAGIIYGAAVLLFGGIGLIVAFIVEMKVGKKDL